MRPAWKGNLKLSLIHIPIRVFAATTAGADVAFHMVHRKCHTRIEMRRWCPHCRKQVDSADVAKAFERSKGRFVLVEQEEISAVRPETTQVIDISDVVDRAAVDPEMIERAYFLAPDTRKDGPAFAVVRDALEDRAAVGHLAMHGREYLVAVVRRDNGLMLFTLRTKGEIRAISAISELAFATGRPKPQELKLARQVLSSFETQADLRSFTDHYQEALRAMLARKTATAVHDADEDAPTTSGSKGKVVNLMEALRASVAAAGTRRTTTRRHTGGRRAG